MNRSTKVNGLTYGLIRDLMESLPGQYTTTGLWPLTGVLARAVTRDWLAERARTAHEREFWLAFYDGLARAHEAAARVHRHRSLLGEPWKSQKRRPVLAACVGIAVEHPTFTRTGFGKCRTPRSDGDGPCSCGRFEVRWAPVVRAQPLAKRRP